MIKKSALFLLGTLLAASCSSTIKEAMYVSSGAYKLDMAHSSVHFKVSHLGLSFYTARFTDFDADLDFDAKNPTKSKIKTVIKANSVKTDYPFLEIKNFDRFLSKNENWLNSRKYPNITFESTKIKRTGFKSGAMYGNLTMLGQTHPVKFKVTFNGAYKNKPHSGKSALGFSAKAVIKRSMWGFDAFVPNIGDDVEIIIETEFEKI